MDKAKHLSFLILNASFLGVFSLVLQGAVETIDERGGRDAGCGSVLRLLRPPLQLCTSTPVVREPA